MSRARTTVFGVISACIACLAAGGASAQHSVARAWDDTMLESIKRDRVRPPVQARNLFHLSVAMYDAWAAYDPAVRPYFFEEKISAKDVEAARHESISYAAYRLMKHRFALSPNVAAINTILDARLTALGYAPGVTTTVGNTPAAVGNRIAALVIQRGLADNSHEEIDHASYPGTYPDLNPALVVALPFNPTVIVPTRYQPLALSFFVDQNGNVIPGGFPAKVAPFWGFVTPFGLQPGDMDPARPGVYLNPPPPPVLNGVGDVAWRGAGRARAGGDRRARRGHHPHRAVAPGRLTRRRAATHSSVPYGEADLSPGSARPRPTDCLSERCLASKSCCPNSW